MDYSENKTANKIELILFIICIVCIMIRVLPITTGSVNLDSILNEVSVGIFTGAITGFITSICVSLKLKEYDDKEREKRKVQLRLHYISHLSDEFDNLVGRFIWATDNIQDDRIVWEIDDKYFFSAFHKIMLKDDLTTITKIPIELITEKMKKLVTIYSRGGTYPYKERYKKIRSALFAGASKLNFELLNLENNKHYVLGEDIFDIFEYRILHDSILNIYNFLSGKDHFIEAIEKIPSILTTIESIEHLKGDPVYVNAGIRTYSTDIELLGDTLPQTVLTLINNRLEI